VEKPLVQAGIAEPVFVNMYALNIYHDGSEGIQMHYDDPQRFERPIISLRLFSDARLAFGTKGYG
jgi:alkylated DNA repair dioxygenase AlkB